MYFENVTLFPLEQHVSNLKNIYAHTGREYKEPLKSHMDLVYTYFLTICKNKNLDNVFKNFEINLFSTNTEVSKVLFKDMFCNAVYMHDIGKINGDFQNRVMENNVYKNTPQEDSNHSMLSSCIYFDYYFNLFKKLKLNGEDLNLLLVFLILNSYVISKHHGSLKDLTIFEDSFKNEYLKFSEKKYLYKDYDIDLNISSKTIEKCFKALRVNLNKLEETKAWQCVDIYIYSKLLSSLLTSSDFYATSHYMDNREIKDFGLIKDINEYYDVFKNGSIYKNIQGHKKFLSGSGNKIFKDNDINKLRSEMFIEAEENLLDNLDKSIFYLEAPTGSGKTNTSINLAFNLMQKDPRLNKLFYIFPFNTLAEQTKDSLEKVFQNNSKFKNSIAVINSVTPIISEDIEEGPTKYKISNEQHNIDYKKSLLNRQFLHYPIVLTSHINFFNFLFGQSREESFPLIYLANSVVILDEIQSYRNSIWKEIIIFLEKYSKLLNIKIIIMSATLPNLSIIGERNECTYLIKNKQKYFNNALFKERVSLDFYLIKRNNLLESLLDKVIETSHTKNKILIEFIKKKSALGFYNNLIENQDKLNSEVLLITGDDNKAERKKIINKIKSDGKFILVATQVIEAGVDIDMDIGFKDISILDAEEQFLGRINRSCIKKDCKVYFFNLDEASLIYKNDFRKQKDLTLEDDVVKNFLLDKNFEDYYSKVLDRIEENSKRENDSNITYFRTKIITPLIYDKIKKRMELIEERYKEYTVFLNTTLDLDNGSILVGNQVWKDYKNLLMNSEMDYAEKRVKLSEILEYVDYFTYKVNRFDDSYSDNIGDIFYIDDGYKYFTNNKFDRSKFNKTEEFELI
ncbi:CRISPR-associated helicase Cas3' [Clostridium algidicarnis]|uniref:CRISPR-associated helicase Cas3' n=1 Tax=Clostridium algidicarnis TaxID=37659 RepID=UPI001C0E6768|nr:CRISPR-associated helicase Cas3' [Clostridium algidicarnis]MBU3207672.1 CRISPR-associated helicase Cas3' [Clostridium algidicarnis]